MNGINRDLKEPLFQIFFADELNGVLVDTKEH